MKKFPKTAIKLNKKRLGITCLYALSSYGFVLVWSLIPREHRYLRQGALAAMGIMFLVTLFSAGKLINREVRLEIGRRIANLLMDFSEKAGKIIGAIRKKLGIPERVRLRGTDEKSFFVFDEHKKKKSGDGKAVRLKWKDMSTDSDKVRFLYISYLTKAISNGYRYSNKNTPLETADDMDASDDGRGLTDMYCRARYSRHFAEPPGNIEKMSDYVKFVDFRNKKE